MATAETVSRPTLDAAMTLRMDAGGDKQRTLENITVVDTKRLWVEFLHGLDRFEETHRLAEREGSR